MAEYRTMDEIRADADTEYHVYWQDYQDEYHMDKMIADDHECALKQVLAGDTCKEVLLVFKGEPLVLWQA